jgi:NADH-quinone oxidoreductase subunit J
VLALLGAFTSLAVIYLLLGFQFIAAAQILVYAGAIMVLFLFVIMLLNLGDPERSEEHAITALGRPRVAWAAGVAGALGVASILAAGSAEVRAADADAAQTPAPVAAAPLDALGGVSEVLFSRFLLPFEAASLLLLATMVGVVVLAKRQRAGAHLPKGHALSLGDAPARPAGSEGRAAS